ncbi:MAG TPA: HNH endonuclease [Gemmatimonadales bacterium]|jgi:putative restriction endonuclease
MPSYPDPDALRLAALAALRNIVAPSGGVITREQMTAGFTFGGERIPFANGPVGIWTPRQLKGHAPLSITTSAHRKGVTPRYDDEIGSDGWFSYRYQGADPDNHFNRSLRKAYTENSPLIYFYGLTPGVYEALSPVYIMDDRPSELTVLVASDVPGLGEGTLLQGGSAAPLKAYATRTVKQRLHQDRFRELVLGAYSHRCTICHLGARDRLVRLLDAAHILEDRDERGLPEVRNGLSLCKIHHAAYDLNILGVAPDHTVHIREDILLERDGPMLQHGIKEMAGKIIRVPQRIGDQPGEELLAERFERFRAA